VGDDPLLEYELFGAVEEVYPRYPCRLDLARGGTFYLEQVGELPLGMQQKLLEAFRAKRFCKVGSNESIPLDVRLIAGSDKDLESEMETGKFSEDFFYHLHGSVLYIPPLRERREDFYFLVTSCLAKILENSGREIRKVTEEAFHLLRSYPWPGNLWELEAVLQKAVLRAPEDTIDKNHILLPVTGGPRQVGGEESPSLRMTVERMLRDKTRTLSKSGAGASPGTIYHEVIREVERSMISSAIRMASGNKLKAARVLGITRTTIRRKMVEYGL
jgi:two-component system nitrogen regulation response regulator GlnG